MVGEDRCKRQQRWTREKANRLQKRRRLWAAGAHLEREGPHEQLHRERRRLVRLIQVGLRRWLGRRLWIRLGDEEEFVSRGSLQIGVAIELVTQGGALGKGVLSSLRVPACLEGDAALRIVPGEDDNLVGSLSVAVHGSTAIAAAGSSTSCIACAESRRAGCCGGTAS